MAGSPSDIAGDFDLAHLPADFIDDPYPYYRALRTHAPIKRMSDGSLFLTRHRDLEHVYKTPSIFISDKKKEFAPKYGIGSPLYEHHTTSLVFNDPPLHTRVRKLIAGALTPRAVRSLEPDLVALVDELLESMWRKGHVDLIEDFAAAIPIEIIGNLLGVPHADRAPLRGWSLAILGALEPNPDANVLEHGNSSVVEFIDYLKLLIDDRRRRPLDPDRDLLTRLLGSNADGEALTEFELYHQCVFLLNAGHETTTNLIGNGLVLLHDHPDSRERIAAEPGIIRTAVEECLRYESSNQLGNRMCIAHTQVGDVEIAPDTPITLCIGAANRDPDEFPEPETFDVGRSPNRHLAFGTGVHQCVGMNVARLEGAVALGRFLQRFPKFSIASPPTRSERVRFRGFLKIPCTLG